MCFVTPEQKLFYGNFLSADSVESVFNQGLNFAKFLLPTGLVASEQKLFYGQLFVTWLSRACIGTRSLISLNFSRPGLGLLCVLWRVQSTSSAASWFTANFCHLTLSSVYWNQGLNFYKHYYALVLFTICFGNCGSTAEVVSRQFLLPDSVERFI